MDPHLVNLILNQLKSHGDKLDSVAADVTIIKTTLEQGHYEDRIQDLEATAWWGKAVVKVVPVVGGVLLLGHQLGIW